MHWILLLLIWPTKAKYAVSSKVASEIGLPKVADSQSFPLINGYYPDRTNSLVAETNETEMP